MKTTFRNLHKMALLLLSLGHLGAQTALNPCDLNADGTVTKADVDLAVNMSLGLIPCTANIISPGLCNVTVVQRVTNAVQGACVTGVIRSATLTWTASATLGVSGYRIYRGTAAGGPYTALNPTKLVTGTSYEDATVRGGLTYYYVVTAVDSKGTESPFSNQAAAIVPVL